MTCNLIHVTQSPIEPAFVQNPYPFYDHARAIGPLVWWEEYKISTATSYQAVGTFLRDRRFGREVPTELAPETPKHLKPFHDFEYHSMLEAEPPRHTRLRSLVLRAFTSRRIAALGPEIAALCHDLIDRFPSGDFDLLPAYARPLPVIIIARLLGVPESLSEQLLSWSNDMVSIYQARRTREIEDRAVKATVEFSDFLRSFVAEKRKRPADDLISHLVQAEDFGDKLSTDELITNCILLLNAGHEATVHTIGNGVKAVLETGTQKALFDSPDTAVEEVLRFDPALHMFTRYAYQDITLFDHTFQRGDQVACLLASANRDPMAYENPNIFDPYRPIKANTSFGAGIHFCVGAPLARLELKIALSTLFERLPNLRIAHKPSFANLYHFHGLERLILGT
jgi:cytochrome P450